MRINDHDPRECRDKANMKHESKIFKSHIGLPDVDVTVPTMITKNEKQMYRHVAERFYRNRGSVVEVGTWLGSSTIHICKGLESNDSKFKLTCVDRFTWANDYQRKFPLPLSAGDSFLPFFKDFLQKYIDHITIVKSDISTLPDAFPAPEPIELLFIDAPKSYKTMDQLLAFFGPHLIENSHIFMQDFLYFPAYTILLSLGTLNSMVPTLIADDGTSITFCIEGDFVEELNEARLSKFERWSAQEIEERWNRLANRLPSEAIQRAWLALPLALISRGFLPQAEAAFDDCPLDANECAASERKSRSLASQVGVEIRYQYDKIANLLAKRQRLLI